LGITARLTPAQREAVMDAVMAAGRTPQPEAGWTGRMARLQARLDG